MTRSFEPQARNVTPGRFLINHLLISRVRVRIPIWVGFVVWTCGTIAAGHLTAPLIIAAPRDASITLQGEATSAFEKGQYDEVIRLLETFPPGQAPPKRLLKSALRSYLHLGRLDLALKTYHRLVPTDRSDDVPLLRELSKGFIASHAHDPEEHVRIATYSTLAETATPDMAPLFEDGLFDSSVIVRARSAEGLGRVGLISPQSKKAAAPPSLQRALRDPAPAVRIAALNALGDIGDRGTVGLILRIAESEEGAPHVFALAALVKLGQFHVLDELRDAATLPDPEARMAALGVLGRLKEPSTLRLISQSVYDPDPSVRAFAAGALGEFGDADAAASLIHAMSDENPRVRSVAAASLGRLKAAQARAQLWQTAKDPVELVRSGAVEGLLRLGDHEAILVAADLAKHPAPSVRSAAAQALGHARNKRVLPLLDLLRQDRQPQPRLTAVRALGRIDGPETVRLLKHSLEDSDAVIRIAAAGSLLQTLPRGK